MFLEASKKRALSAMFETGDAAFNASNADDQILVGIGYAVGKGWAAYRGGKSFRITDLGRSALAELNSDDPADEIEVGEFSAR